MSKIIVVGSSNTDMVVPPIYQHRERQSLVVSFL